MPGRAPLIKVTGTGSAGALGRYLAAAFCFELSVAAADTCASMLCLKKEAT